jgi:hypothetical protein
MLPPRLVRRLVVAPIVIVVALGIVVLSPLLAVLALLFGLAGLLRAGRMRNLRLVSFLVVGLTAELVTLFVLLGLWVVSGFGGRLQTEPYQKRHYAVVRRFLDALYRGAERTYGLRVEVEEPDLTGEELASRASRPVIVLSRHAGPGDSFLLIHQLLSVYGRRPRVVMKATMQFDPSLDVLGNRLPNVFIQRQQTGESIFTDQIERLARGLDANGALAIFPEGANWTPNRWRRGIRRLERAGRSDLAERARDMPNLLPPRPGGALAAIAACPEADVIFVAHAGLDTITSVGDVWRRFPVDQVVRARWWRVLSEQVPRDADHEAQVQWLYQWWERIDAWITENRPSGVPVPDQPSALPAGSLPRLVCCAASFAGALAGEDADGEGRRVGDGGLEDREDVDGVGPHRRCLARGGVDAGAVLAVLQGLVDGRRRDARVLGELAHRGREALQHDPRTGRLGSRPPAGDRARELGQGLLDVREGRAAARDDRVVHGQARDPQAALGSRHPARRLGSGRACGPHRGGTAREPRQPREEYLALLVELGRVDLRPDLPDPGGEHGGIRRPAHDERAVAGGDDLLRAAEHRRPELGRRPELRCRAACDTGAYDAGAGHDGEVTQDRLAGVPVTGHPGGQGDAASARPARGQDLKRRARHAACQYDERPAGRGRRVDDREQVLGRGDLGIDEKQGRTAQDRLAALGVRDEVGTDVAAVDRHPLAQSEFQARLPGGLHGNDAVLADLVEGLGQQAGERLVEDGRRYDRGDLLLRPKVRGPPAEFVDHPVPCGLDTPRQAHRIGPSIQGGDRSPDHRSGEHHRGRRAVRHRRVLVAHEVTDITRTQASTGIAGREARDDRFRVGRLDVAARLVLDDGRTACRPERTRYEPGHHADARRGTATAISSRMHAPILPAFRALPGWTRAIAWPSSVTPVS